MDIVATTDDVANATGMLMRPETYFERIGPGFKQAIEGYKDLGYLCIKHCDGNIDAVSDFWIDCGIDCLDPIDPGAGYTMAGMKAKYGDRSLPERQHRLHRGAVRRNAGGSGRGSAAVHPGGCGRRRADPLVQQHDPPRREAGELPGHARRRAGNTGDTEHKWTRRRMVARGPRRGR